MNLQKIVVFSAVLAVGSTLTVQARQGTAAMTPAQGGRGAAGGVITARPTLPVTRAIESKIVKGAPYSAEMVTESIQTLADGNRIVQRTTGRVYRDGEGRIRREEDRPSGSPSITITDPVAKTTTMLDVAAHTARETAMGLFQNYTVALNTLATRIQEVQPQAGVVTPAPATGGGGGRGGRIVGSTDAPSLRSGGGGGRGGAGAGTPAGGTVAARPLAAGRGAAPRDERTEETLPSRQIEGVMCTGIRRTTTIAKGVIGNEQPIKIVSEEWTSTDLQVLVLTDVNDPRTGRSTYQLQRIARVEPESSLFKVPGDFTVERAAGAGRGRGEIK